MLVFIATPDWIAAMQIGDGFIVVRSQDNPDYKLLFPPDKGEYANETTFVTSTNVRTQMRVKVLEGEYTFICASTDGLERIAINTRTWTPHSPFFRPFEEGMKDNSEDEERKFLKDWLDSQEVNAKTDDDKTLLLCFQNSSSQSSNPGSIAITQDSQLNDSLVEPKDEHKYKLIFIQNPLFNLLAGAFCNAQYHYSLLENSTREYFFLKKAIVWLVISSIFGIFNWLSFVILRKTFSINFIRSLIIVISSSVFGITVGALFYYYVWQFFKI